MNLSIFRTELWVLWQMTRLEFPPRVLAPVVYVWLFSFVHADVLEYTKSINFFFIVLASLCSTLWIGSYDKRLLSGGFPFALSFPRPIPTLGMVVVPLAWLMMSNVAIYLVVVSVVDFLFGVKYPGLAMAPPLLVASAVLAAISWALCRVLERAIASVVVLGLSIFWFAPRLARLDPLQSGRPDLDAAVRLSAVEYGAFALVVLLAVLLTILSVSRQRHGERLTGLFGRFPARFEALLDLERFDGFRSPRHAQLWFELRRTATRCAATVVVSVIAFVLAAWLSAESGGDSIFALLGVAGLQLVPLALLVASVEGMLGLKMRGQELRLSVFEATLPVTVAGSVGLKLILCLLVSLASWSVFVIAALLVAIGFDGGLQDNLKALFEVGASVSRLEVVLWVVLCIAGFAFVSPCAALLLMSLGYIAPRLRSYTANTVPLALCVVATMGLPVVGGVGGWDLSIAWKMLLVCWGLFFVAVAVLSIRFALRNRYLGSRLIAGLLVSWGALITLAAGLLWGAGANFGAMSPHGAVLIAGLLCLPVATTAWAPMALGALRHQ